MHKVKRVKGGVDAWAVSFSPSGHVSEWTANEKVAKEFDSENGTDQAIAINVCGFYRCRAECGVLTFEPGGKPINDAAKALATEAKNKQIEADSIAVMRDKASRFEEAEQGRIAAGKRLAEYLAGCPNEPATNGCEAERAAIANYLDELCKTRHSKWFAETCAAVRDGTYAQPVESTEPTGE